MINLRSGTHIVPQFTFDCGQTLYDIPIAYETYGQLDAGGGNAILVSHGFASDHHAGGDGGWWSGLIGSGKALDTDRYFLICMNNPGSCFGSIGPATTIPGAGRPYGPDFPDVTVADMVEAQRLTLDALGVGKLAAAIGYSFGGYLTFQWAVAHPDRMRAVVVAASRIYDGGGPEKVAGMVSNFDKAPGWNGGNYYERPDGVLEALKQFRAGELRRNGLVSEMLSKTGGDESAANRLVEAAAARWASEVDANSLIALTRAGVAFDLSDRVGEIKVPLLYVLCDTDNLYPGAAGPKAVDRMQSLGVDATFHEIKTVHRHRGGLVDHEKWSGVLAAFLASHAAP